MDITVSEFRDDFPEFSSSSDALVGRAIRLAYQLTDISREATLHCAAHIVAMASQQTGAADGGSAEVVSEQIGSMMVTYRTMAMEGYETFFTQTAYGRLMIALEKRRGTTALGGILVA